MPCATGKAELLRRTNCAVDLCVALMRLMMPMQRGPHVFGGYSNKSGEGFAGAGETFAAIWVLGGSLRFRWGQLSSRSAAQRVGYNSEHNNMEPVPMK